MTILVEAAVDLPLAPPDALRLARAFDPVAIVRPEGPVPGVAAFEGPRMWSEPGDKRRLTLTDGTVLGETLLDLGETFYDYRVEGFAGWFGRLAERAESRFEALPSTDGSRLVWRTRFVARGPLAARALGFVVRPLWPPFMRAALLRLADAARKTAS